ncbi:MAG: hypothetical protein [Bacteriophage sp.]|nr:MAG: hypothetical protein [Bacteriophage sp.]
MEEKKHYNRGKEIAITFPISKEKLEQDKLNKELKEELAKTKAQNKKQAELLKQLEEKIKKEK